MMTRHKQTAPRLRFKGFDGAWEEKTIFELAQDNKLNNGVFNDKNKVGHGYKLINVLDMYLESSIDENTLQLLDLERNEFLRNKVVYGDVFFTRSSLVKEGIAHSNVYLGNSDDITYDGHLIKLTPNQDLVNPVFLNYELKTTSVRRQFITGGKTTTMTTIGQQEIGESTVILPQLPEQAQLGNFFRELDHRIAQSRALWEKSRQLKKAMLAKMFPAAGETAPKIRFQGFTGEWERKTLGEVAEVFDGTHQTPKYTDNGVMFLSVENISTLTSEKFISEHDFQKEFKNFPQKGDVLMTRIGDVGTANVVTSEQPLAYYVSLALLKPKTINPYFLSTAIASSNVQSDIEKRTLHVAFPKKINKGEIEKIEILIPSPEEQTAIGNFFRQLDDAIALHALETETLGRLKKALLAAMLV